MTDLNILIENLLPIHTNNIAKKKKKKKKTIARQNCLKVAPIIWGPVYTSAFLFKTVF